MATQTTDLDRMAEAVWNQLHTECIDRIEAYQTDLLIHDKQWILEHPKVPFVHVTRKWGTDMIALNTLAFYPERGEWVRFLFGTAQRDHILQSRKDLFKAILRSWGNEDIQWLYFDGSRLWESGAKEAERIIDRYVALVTRVWWHRPLQRLAVPDPTPARIYIHQSQGYIRGSVDGELFAFRGDEDMAILLSVLLEADGHVAMYS